VTIVIIVVLTKNDCSATVTVLLLNGGCHCDEDGLMLAEAICCCYSAVSCRHCELYRFNYFLQFQNGVYPLIFTVELLKLIIGA